MHSLQSFSLFFSSTYPLVGPSFSLLLSSNLLFFTLFMLWNTSPLFVPDTFLPWDSAPPLKVCDPLILYYFLVSLMVLAESLVVVLLVPCFCYTAALLSPIFFLCCWILLKNDLKLKWRWLILLESSVKVFLHLETKCKFCSHVCWSEVVRIKYQRSKMRVSTCVSEEQSQI